MVETFGALSVLVTIFLVILALLWFFLPFAIFGTKPLLRDLISELKELNKKQLQTNQKLEQLLERQNDRTKPVNPNKEIKETLNGIKTESKIHFSCDKCGTKLVAGKEHIGKPGKCNNCGTRIIIPGPIEIS